MDPDGSCALADQQWPRAGGKRARTPRSTKARGCRCDEPVHSCYRENRSRSWLCHRLANSTSYALRQRRSRDRATLRSGIIVGFCQFAYLGSGRTSSFGRAADLFDPIRECDDAVRNLDRSPGSAKRRECVGRRQQPRRPRYWGLDRLRMGARLYVEREPRSAGWCCPDVSARRPCRYHNHAPSS